MKKRFLLSSAAIGVFGSVLTYLTLVDSDIYAQGARTSGPAVRQTVSVSKANEGSGRFASAVVENRKLRSSLHWLFGGKMQTGWNIYVPLISQTIEANGDPDSAEFAEAVSKWQQKSGLDATGILDKATLESFTKYWQSRRLGRGSLLPTDFLLAAPISDFFDATRSPDLLQLETETYSAYKLMIAAASKDLQLKINPSGGLAANERYLKIVSAYRSPAYQESLRKKEPNAGRAALATNSPHSTGHALDIFVGGEPVKTEDSNRLLQVQTPAYKWLVKNAHRFGFYPYFYEPWHWEYVPGSK
ncbi:MAG: D-alanyl-D-alanine carboxypeptidase family protein [Pyrinomonadaceae bacterium]